MNMAGNNRESKTISTTGKTLRSKTELYPTQHFKMNNGYKGDTDRLKFRSY